MPEYMRSRAIPQSTNRQEDTAFCRFTFGQFFALLVLEVFTLFFVFYLGARYGREFLGLDRQQMASSSTGSDAAVTIDNRVLSVH